MNVIERYCYPKCLVPAVFSSPFIKLHRLFFYTSFPRAECYTYMANSKQEGTLIKISVTILNDRKVRHSSLTLREIV